MNNKYRHNFIFLLILFAITQLQWYKISAQDNVEEYIFKRAFIYKVSVRFIEWPNGSNATNKNTPFIIAIIGEDPFEGKLNELENNKNLKINEKPIKVKNIHTFKEIETCDLLFISSSEKYDISKIIKETHGKPILTIGDTKGYAEKGVMIQMFIRGAYVRFNINKKEADACGIKISSYLLGKAEKVIK